MLGATMTILADHLPIGDTAVALQAAQNLLALRAGPDAQLGGGAADGFFRPVAGQPAKAFVDLDETPGTALADDDGIGAGVERLGELGLAGLERRLGLLPFGDVAKSGDDAQPPFDADEAAGYHAGDGIAGPGAELRFGVFQMLVAAQLLIKGAPLILVVPDANFRCRAADDVGVLPAEHRAEARVDIDEHAIADARQGDRVGTALEQGGELGFRGGQRLFAQDPLGGVDDDARHAQRFAVLVAIQLGGALQVTHPAVGVVCLVGRLVGLAPSGQEIGVRPAHGLAVARRDTAKELTEGAIERALDQSLQFRGACRGVQAVALDVPLPVAQARRGECQFEPLLAVLQRLRLDVLSGDVAHDANEHWQPVAVLPLALEFQPMQAGVRPADAMA